MKNFKKVISAVIALTMAISSFATVSASKFTDVAETATYAEAVEVLSALGVVNGVEQEDGSFIFEPEKAVTRAEATTMVVGALNMTDDAKASAGTSRFTDVNADAAWAAGYVNVGVAQGFIVGVDDTTFKPTDSVTYEQMCVMLTKIAGYGEYAAANSTGKWSAGYTSMAASTGINKGVAVADETALTKGQVAQMIYNTLVTPMLGVAEYSLTGNTYSQLDGKNDREFKTLLADKFDGYVATVLIDETPLTADLDSDEVEFIVKKAAWWPDSTEAPVLSEDDEVDTGSLVAAGVDVNGNYLQTGKAVFVTNDDDDLVMVYFAPTGKTVTKEFPAEDYVLQEDLRGDNLYAESQKIKFGSTSYKMEEGFNIYVNGVKYKENIKTTTTDVAATLDALLGGAQGTIKLIKDADAKNYTDVFVEYYEVAKVTAVSYKGGETIISMTTKNAINTNYDEIKITDENIEEGKVTVSVSRNGAEAELASIVKGDIIAYATDFNLTNKTIEDPKSIKILATNEVASGKVTSVDEDEKTHTIDGKEYKSVSFNKNMPEIKKSYELTLDPFGRIFAAEVDGTSDKYAMIVKKTTTGVQLVLADGSSKTYELSSKAEKALEDAADAAEYSSETTFVNELDVEDRIIAYTLKTSSNEITSLEFVTDAAFIDFAEYKARTGKLGSATISSSTQVIDARDAVEDGANKASNYGAFAADNFQDGVTYEGYSISVGTYTNFVVITRVGTKFNEEVRFAVVRKAAQEFTTEDGDNVDKVLVLYNGAEEELLFEQKTYADAELKVGDAFFFEENSDGYVDTIYTIYKKGTDSIITLEDAGVDAADLPKNNKGWSYNLWAAQVDEEGNETGVKTDIQLVAGYVVDVQSNSITLTTTDAVDAGYIETALDIDDVDGKEKGVAIFGIDPACVAYEYDNDEDIVKEIDRFSAFDGASVKASAFGRFELPDDTSILVESYEDEDENVIELGDMNDYANFAVAMIVDGDIVAIYTVIPE